MSRRTTIAVVCFALALALPPAAARAQASVARTAADVAFAPRIGATVPLDATFCGDDGRTTTLAERLGERPAVLALVYYRCPMLCNLVVEGMLRSLAGVSLAAGSDYDVVLVSIDPRETPADGRRRRAAVQQQSGDRQGGAGWSFLTGDEAQVHALADAVGFRYVYDEATAQYAHGAGIVLLDRRGTVSRFLGGIDFPSRDLQLGLVESSAGSAGTAVDRLLLLCYRYDPATGRYGFATFAALRVLGVLTVAVTAATIVLMLRRERRRRRDGEVV